MKISHELPLSLLKNSYQWNDYEYCLPIFMKKFPQYKNHYIKARDDGRFIIMDNSLFEGYYHSDSELLEFINEIKPDIFIVPDEWNDKNKTLVNAKSWILNYKSKLPKNTNLMTVLQGKTYGELVECYQTFVDLGYKHISFNHSSEAYFDIFPTKPKLIAQSEGRKYLIDNLIKDNILNPKLYHHLLGCSLPQEFKYYKDMDWIKSCDTSAPIINGALGVIFDDHEYEKPKQKLEEFMELEFTPLQLSDINYNISIFREICQDF
jgi:hypothetical protein